MPTLSQKTIDALMSDGTDRFMWDEEVVGFGVRIKPTGVATYVVQYRNTDGRTRRFSLGKANALTLKDARKEARIRLAEVAKGGDPSGDKKKERAAKTIEELCDYFLTVYAKERKLSQRYVGDCGTLIAYVINPRWGTYKVKSIDRDDVRRLKIDLSATPIRANRCLALVSKLMNLAIEQKERLDNPVKGIERNQEEKRDAYMSLDELERLMAVLQNEEDQDQADAIRLLICTGARIGEVLSAEWAQFDLTERRWTKPPSKTKQRKVHRVGLSGLTIEVLTGLKARATVPDGSLKSRFLFPNKADNDRPRPDIKKFWRRVSKKAALDEFRLYDARHTFASHLLINGVPLGVVGAMLGHSQPATTARYAHVGETVTKLASEKFAELLKGVI